MDYLRRELAEADDVGDVALVPPDLPHLLE